MLAQDSPIQDWIADWTEFLGRTIVAVAIVVIFLLGMVILVRRTRIERVWVRLIHAGEVVREWEMVRRLGGGPRAAVVFGVVIALVLYLLTHTVDIADWFRDELPLDRD